MSSLCLKTNLSPAFFGRQSGSASATVVFLFVIVATAEPVVTAMSLRENISEVPLRFAFFGSFVSRDFCINHATALQVLDSKLHLVEDCGR